MVLSLHPEEMVVDVAQLGNRIKDGMGKWTLNVSKCGVALLMQPGSVTRWYCASQLRAFS